MRRAIVRGIGSYLPQRVVPNAELALKVDTSDEWIVQRTGIRQRHIAAEGELTSQMAIEAAKRALHKANISPIDLDLIIVATSTPDSTFPATAATVQAELGAHAAAAFDVQAVCTGFVYALSVADAMLQAHHYNRVLVIGAETYSRILDWNDRGTCVLFGDGAGAIVLEAQNGEGKITDRGVLLTRLRADGRHRDKLFVDGGPSSTQTAGHLRMEGREVYKLAVGVVPEVIDDVLETTKLTAQDIDWFVPHQANLRIIKATADKLGLSMDKVVVTVHDHANTSSASIPLALDVAVRDGRIKPGDLVLLEAMGGGFTWGAALLRW